MARSVEERLRAIAEFNRQQIGTAMGEISERRLLADVLEDTDDVRARDVPDDSDVPGGHVDAAAGDGADPVRGMAAMSEREQDEALLQAYAVVVARAGKQCDPDGKLPCACNYRTLREAFESVLQ